MKSIGWLLALGAFAAIACSTSARAQNCTPLQVVGGSGTEVSKSVSPPSTIFSKNNWNTDFIVPQSQYFSTFVAEIEPQEAGEYTIKMFLKYNNDTADKVYDRTAIPLTNSRPAVITGSARRDAQPYQINLLVGGIQASGEFYTASVRGCR
ncbi:MAG: hypothetical protein AAF704_13590 [Cyanobacteria bacterium P01_D01_bin.123]